VASCRQAPPPQFSKQTGKSDKSSESPDGYFQAALPFRPRPCPVSPFKLSLFLLLRWGVSFLWPKLPGPVFPLSSCQISSPGPPVRFRRSTRHGPPRVEPVSGSLHVKTSPSPSRLFAARSGPFLLSVYLQGAPPPPRVWNDILTLPGLRSL